MTFRLKGDGRIGAGARANIVVFDAERVADRATFKASTQCPIGIEHVIVEGRPVATGDAPEVRGSGITL